MSAAPYPDEDPGPGTLPPPFSEPAEQAIVGLLVRGPDQGGIRWAAFESEVSVGDFWIHAHQTIVRTVAGMEGRGEAVDFVTLTATLERINALEDAGGLIYLNALRDASVSPSVAAGYARIVAYHAKARRMMALGSRLAVGPNGSDVADMLEGARTELDALANDATAVRRPRPPPVASLAITADELAAARLTPRCFVRDLLYADVAELVGPGSTGKTTTLIPVAISIALGLPIWGLEVITRGWTLFVTAEDQRQRLVARLREILAAMDLTDDEKAIVCRSFLIWDVTGQQAKLVRGEDGNIVLTKLADDLVDAYKNHPPALIVFDPLVSFGASEQAINDNEQAIVTAGRRIVNGLGCCCLVIHHTGQQGAREKIIDQYAGRGGSALSDGCRMVLVMQRWDPGDKLTPPPACLPDSASSITILARAKLSYAPPNLPLIWIKRTGFAFESFADLTRTHEEVRSAKEDQLLRFLASELASGRYHTQTTLDGMLATVGMTRSELKGALAGLRSSGKVYDAAVPDKLRHGGFKTHIAPANPADPLGGVHPSEPGSDDPDPAASTTPPAYREKNGGGVAAPSFPLVPCHPAEVSGGVPAGWRGSDEGDPWAGMDAAYFGPTDLEDIIIEPAFH